MDIITNIIGLAATIVSLTIVFVGLPQQIYKNWKNKNCKGLATSLIFAAFGTYTLWSLYGWMKPELFLAISQTPGSIFALILVIQFFLYKKKRPE
jgi:uncharacterized protein with PQ loop repeat